ncbi:hypothetical protein P7C70_g7403, partial [Phenoliferia sp. Uapishka_3]
SYFLLPLTLPIDPFLSSPVAHHTNRPLPHNDLPSPVPILLPPLPNLRSLPTLIPSRSTPHLQFIHFTTSSSAHHHQENAGELRGEMGCVKFMLVAFACLFVAVQVMFEYREEERRRGIVRRF